MDRREFIIRSGVAASVPFSLTACSTSTKPSSGTPLQSSKKIERIKGALNWLDGDKPGELKGTTFGYPWKQGALREGEPLSLVNEKSEQIPLQTWVTAFWPDGSVKWTAHAIPASIEVGRAAKIIKAAPTIPSTPVKVSENDNAVTLSTGIAQFEIPKQGTHIVSKLMRGNKLVGQNAHLVGLVKSSPDFNSVTTQFSSKIQSVTVEQTGPVRAVIKVEGVHARENSKQWLPFTIRLYEGLGLRFSVLQNDELYDRHLRLVGEGEGLWAEAVKGITGLRRDPGQAVKDAQIAGRKTPPLSEWDERVSSRLQYIPVWNDVTLTQIGANGFEIKKRTKEGHGWIGVDQGTRASGVGYLGGCSGGIAFGMRDFWQLHPAQIDIRDAGEAISHATIWFYSPEAPAMDVRFYHDGMGQETYEEQLDALNIIYEDYEPGFGDAHGIARTTEFTLSVKASTPTRDDIIRMAEQVRHPSRLVAAPIDYLEAKVFGGVWSLPDRSTPERKQIEDRLAWQVHYYAGQVEQRHWYGFWNYGDIMHTYDADRHVWRYDIGGYAWDNSELSPDLWLWYSFLRSGDPTSFHLAERMTRHNRDVDIYHAGKFKGLGTRHNVQHWGCSAKQMRISTAAYRRFHYYITGDERTGDVLNEVANADAALAVVNPTRKVDKVNPIPGLAKMGVGTDWGSTAANWLTAWERSGNDEYKEKLVNAMKVIGSHPQGFFAGAFGYNVKTQKLVPYEDTGPKLSHLSSVFGLIEISTELLQLLDVPEYKKAWLQYGRLYSAPASEQAEVLGKRMKGNSLTVAHSRLTAYVAAQENDEALAKRAWREFNKASSQGAIQTDCIAGPRTLNSVDEAAWLATNDASQWGLAAIQNLALIKDAL